MSKPIRNPGQFHGTSRIGVEARLGLAITLLFFAGCFAHTPTASQKIASMLPKEDDFRFEIPQGWGANLLEGAVLVETTAKGDREEIAKIVDGKPSTSWTAKGYGYKPTFTFDLGQTVVINRLVIFNRHTDMRGTGGGCNAAKELIISAAAESVAEAFSDISTIELTGPRAQCIEHEDEHICFFVDNTEPTIVELREVSARFLRIQIASAYWSAIAEAEWPDELSYALSEVMAFLAP